LQTAVKVRYSIKDSWDLEFENIGLVVVCASAGYILLYIVITGDTAGKSPCDRHYEMRGRKRVLLAGRKESVKTCKLIKCLMACLKCIYGPDSTLIKNLTNWYT